MQTARIYLRSRTNIFEAKDWRQLGVDIRTEFLETSSGGVDNSIHGFLRKDLAAGPSEIAIYDHGTGEIGDFVTLREGIGDVEFCLYHCKGSSGVEPGERVADVYEVAGQVVKSLIWLKSADDLKTKILARLDGGSELLRGDRSALKALFTTARKKPFRFTIYCVQPGLSARALPTS